MGKYEQLQQDVFSIFASNAWKLENIKTYPQGYTATQTDSEFVRVSIVPSGLGANPISASGLLIVEIYTAAGRGPSRLMALADTLDRFLSQKTISASPTTSTQLYASTVSGSSFDKDNPTLIKSKFSIPFTYSGVA